MAIYHLETKIISRSQGRSAVAAAAYRSGEKLKNIYDGQSHDYTHKGGVEYSEIFLPENAPKEYSDREKLWNAVELAEKSSDARLAREVVIALPVELSRKDQIELVRQYVTENFTSQGMIADVNLHDPVLTDDLHRPIDTDGFPVDNPTKFVHQNPHVHIMLTLRPLNDNGEWQAKKQKEYVCRISGETNERNFTAEELNFASVDGWEKQFKYIDSSGKKIWLTPSESEKEGLTNDNRVNRQPKITKGRENPISAEWNSVESLRKWRKSWELLVNKKFQKLDIAERIDSRSYLEQGKDKIPNMHLGYEATNMLKKQQRLGKKKTANPIEKAEYNRLVKGYNRSAKHQEQIRKEVNIKINNITKKLETLRTDMAHSQIIAAGLTKAINSKQKETDDKAADISNILASIEAMLSLNASAESSIANLTKLLNSCSPLQVKKQKELKEQIVAEQQQINERKAYIQSEMQKRGYSDEKALRTAEQKQKQAQAHIQNRKAQIAKLRNDYSVQEAEYTTIIESIPASLKSSVLGEKYMNMPKGKNAETEHTETAIEKFKNQSASKQSSLHSSIKDKKRQHSTIR